MCDTDTLYHEVCVRVPGPLQIPASSYCASWEADDGWLHQGGEPQRSAHIPSVWDVSCFSSPYLFKLKKIFIEISMMHSFRILLGEQEDPLRVLTNGRLHLSVTYHSRGYEHSPSFTHGKLSKCHSSWI